MTLCSCSSHVPRPVRLRERGRGREKETGGGRIVTTAGALVCHLCLRQIIRETGAGGPKEKETEKCRGGGGRSGRGEGFLEAQRSVDVSLSS